MAAGNGDAFTGKHWIKRTEAARPVCRRLVGDEWKILPAVTINYGARFDYYGSTADNESQVSPRANLVWQPFDATTLHAGYSRYFTPPPLETVPAQNITTFNGTSGASAVTTADPVGAERANYYDVRHHTQKLTARIAGGPGRLLQSRAKSGSTTDYLDSP